MNHMCILSSNISDLFSRQMILSRPNHAGICNISYVTRSSLDTPTSRDHHWTHLRHVIIIGHTYVT